MHWTVKWTVIGAVAHMLLVWGLFLEEIVERL